MTRFPTKERLAEAFAPKNWHLFLSNEAACVTYPTATLGRVDALYSSPGLAVSLVRAQLMGVYVMAAANGSVPNMDAVNMTASLFVAGNRGCGLYQMALYFAGYQGSYKSHRSYMSFDTGDLLSAFRTNFLPRWQQLRAKYMEQQPEQQRPVGAVGLVARAAHIRSEVERYGGGEQGVREYMRRSGLVLSGMITEADVRRALEEADRAF